MKQSFLFCPGIVVQPWGWNQHNVLEISFPPNESHAVTLIWSELVLLFNQLFQDSVRTANHMWMLQCNAFSASTKMLRWDREEHCSLYRKFRALRQSHVTRCLFTLRSRPMTSPPSNAPVTWPWSCGVRGND
jgi:hypothetical protein